MGPYQSCAEAAGAYDTMLLSICGLSAGEFTNFATHLVDMSQPKLPVSRLNVTRAVQFPAIPMMCAWGGSPCAVAVCYMCWA
jgi:hypothetical protein